MSIWFWVFMVVVAIAILFYIGARLNQRTCLLAFGAGVTDASSTPWKEIERKYRSYLQPMRPMDATSYRRGVEYCLKSEKGSTWEDMKRDFKEALKSGAITREGTAIRSMGAQAAGNKLKLRIPEELEILVTSNPNYPPLIAKVKPEDAGT